MRIALALEPPTVVALEQFRARDAGRAEVADLVLVTALLLPLLPAQPPGPLIQVEANHAIGVLRGLPLLPLPRRPTA